MEILNAVQIRNWDQYTIVNEPIASIDLMERAATACVEWIGLNLGVQEHFRIFCGKGNNGGDGLAIARLLIKKNKNVSVHILENGAQGSNDFQVNLQRLHRITDKIHFIQSPEHFPLVSTDEIVIDSLFGTGLDRPLSELAASLVEYINHSKAYVVSIDLPSGMFADQSSKGNPVVRAHFTLSFQCWKLCFLAMENEGLIGNLHILPIGLHPDYLKQANISNFFTSSTYLWSVYRKRKRFAHKGNFGHCLIAGGSYGKMGAMVLATRACLHGGAGLTTAFIPGCGYTILQTTVPEAMVITGNQENFLTGLPEDIEKFSSIGAGPGMGTEAGTIQMLSFLIRRFGNPMVLDADALNCMSQEPSLVEQLPPLSILTPHPKEFDRLFGMQSGEFERWRTASEHAGRLNIIIIVKGHHTAICLPGGQIYFNPTGNAGMAKGGSGDVLTGIITSLLAQGYTSKAAAIMGVYLHGLAGDLAASALSEETMTASDIIDFLAPAFRQVSSITPS